MAIDGLGAAPQAAAGSASSDTVSNEDMAKFEQAFLDAVPQAAMFMLQNITGDTLQEVGSIGEEQEPN